VVVADGAIAINHRTHNFGRGGVFNKRRPGRFMARIFYWL
jgi:hypothetical protein